MADNLDALFAQARINGSHVPQATTGGGDPLDGQWGAEDAKAAGLASQGASSYNPDQMGEASRLSRDTGVPYDTIYRNLPSVKAARQAQFNLSQFQASPTLAAWATDPRYSALASDDMQRLRRVGDATGTISALNAPTPSLWSVLKGLGSSFVQGAQQIPLSLAHQAEDLWNATVGHREWQRDLASGAFQLVRSAPANDGYGRPIQSENADALAQLKAKAAVTNPAFKSWYGQSLYSGASNLLQNAPGIVASIATGNPLPAIAAGSMQAQTQAYEDIRDAGGSTRAALLGSTGIGAIEAATEFIPTSYLVNQFGKRSATKFAAGFLGRELPTEEIATITQNAVQTAATPGQTWNDYIRQLPADMRDTAIAVGMMSLVTGGAEHIAHRFAHNAEDLNQAGRGAGNATAIDAMMQEAAQSKTRDRDPEAFRDFIAAHTDGTPAENLYVSGDKIRELFQSDDYDPHDATYQWLAGFNDQADEASRIGGDVVIPMADAVTNLAGTPLWDKMRGDVRVAPGGMSENEARSFEKDYGDTIERQRIAVEAATRADEEADAPAREVYNTIYQQMRSAGFIHDAADAYAQLWASRYSARAAAVGSDPLTAFHDANTTIRRDAPAIVEGYRSADQLDLLINAMRGKERTVSQGPSLLDWISRAGGIEDKGGDIAKMGGNQWHTEKAFRRRLIRETAEDNPTFIGMENTSTGYGLDDYAQSAWDQGYFPDATERPTTNDLLDAIGDELRGNPRYAHSPFIDAEQEANAAAHEAGNSLRAFLENRGIDADTATRAEIEKAIDGEPSAARSLDQSARGRIDLFDDGRRVIRLFENADLSTFLHESGHLWLEELQQDATAAGEGSRLGDDWQTVKDWFAKNGHAVEGDAIPTEAHELWARGFERYLMEGKAPSTVLGRVFERFRSWLLRIYGVVNNLRSPITPQVREVFDRLIATRDEIRQAEEEQHLHALFTDAAQAGMTEDEFAAYWQMAGDARSEAFNALVYKTMHAIRVERTKEWHTAEKTVRAEIEQQINARPEFRALHLLRTGRWLGEAERAPLPVKLDRQWLVEHYGTDAVKLLPKGVPPIYSETDGINPDDIANLIGFSSGDDMVKALMGIEAAQKPMRANGDKRALRDRLIDEETKATMRERYGDPLNDGAIEEEALAAVHNSRQGELLAAEARALSRSGTRTDPATPYRLARDWARGKIGQGRVQDVASRAALARYSRAAAKAGRAAERALIAGDVDESFRQKQAQLLNHALLTEAKIAADEVEAAIKRLSYLGRKRTLGSIDQDYLDRVHAQLEKFDFRPSTQRALAERASFSDWAAAQRGNGVDIITPPRLEDRGEHYTRISVDELRGLRDSVEQLVELGRLKQKLIDQKEERDFDEVVAEAIHGASLLPQKAPSDLMEPSWGDRFKSGVASADAALLKMEQVFDWLDHNDASGVFNRIVFQPLSEAQDRENDMMADYLGRVREAMSGIDQATLKRWSEQVRIPELMNRETGNPWVLTRQQLVSMALNVGNAGNLQRLVDGYGWREPQVLAVLNRELSAQEWQFVQKIWDTFETLYPDIAKMERSINGFAPEKIEAVPVVTPDAVLRGGYFPAVYDTTKSLRAEVAAGKSSDLFETNYTRATTRAASTNERSEQVKRPILLNLGVINRHLGETIHDITHRQAIMNADKFLSEERVAAAIDQSLGPEIRKQFRPWLKHVANRWATERAGNEGLGKWVNKARANTTIVGMGFRASSIMSQLAGYSNSAEYVGAKHMAVALAASAKSPIDTFNFVMERSGEVRHRMDTLDRDINVAINQLSGRNDWYAAGKRFAFHGIGYMDRVVAVPTWMAGYNRAIEAGRSEEQAIYEGDKAVRLSQGAGSAKDLAAVQRGTGKHGEMLKFLTMFYSYFSAFYQRERTLGRDIGQAVRERSTRDLTKLAARAFFLVALPPVLADLLAGRGPDPDEDWGEWAFKKMIVQLLGPIPLVKDLIEPAWDKLTGQHTFGFQLSPLQAAGDSIITAAQDVHDLVTGKGTKHATRDALQAAGYTTGLVPGQVASAAQFFVDVAEGDQDPQTVAEWYRGVTTGHAKPPEGRGS